MTSREELASVIGLIASSSTSRETLVPDGKLGEADNAYTVNVYTLIPGPFEHGGAYASCLFTLLVPTVPGAGPPARTFVVVEGML